MNSAKQYWRETLGIHQRVAIAGLAFVIVLASSVFTTRLAQAQTLSVLYAFTGGTDGAGPRAGLVRDAKGNLHGTTYYGGAYGNGTVYNFVP